MSLRWRIALSMALIAALASLFGAVAAYLSTQDRLTASLDESLTSRAATLTGAATSPPDGDRDRNGLSRTPDHDPCPPAGLLQPANGGQVIAADGTVTSCIAEGVAFPVDDHLIAAVRTKGTTRLDTVGAGGEDYRVVTLRQPDGSVLQFGRSTAEIHRVLDSLRARLIVFALAAVLAAAGLGWLLATRIVAPIRRLQSAAQHIADTGELDHDLPSTGPGEVGSLTTSFATMVAALADSRARQQRLVADASHELRTPLTSLQTNAELLGRGDQLTVEQRRQVSAGIRSEVHELTDLVSELVALARDPGNDDEPVTAVDLDALTRDAVGAARRRSDRTITVSVHDARNVRGRERLLGRAVTNLVDNALQHGTGDVEVGLEATTISVRDHGGGIPEADLPRIFDRFYRTDASRTEPGSGLGLAIVAQIAEQHGGTVFARNHPDGGAVVGFTLPVP